MTSFLSFLKKHKIGLIVLTIIVVIAIVTVIAVKNIFENFGIGKETTTYNPKRLEEAEKVGLKNDTLDKIIATLKENEKVKSANYHIAGVTINFTIEVEKSMSKDEAKKLGVPILSALTEDEKKVYSVQLFITCKEESEVYPLNAYKHRTSTDFSW